MPSGNTTSKAEIRSVATITSCSPLMLYTSRTFPWYTLFCPGKLKSVFVNAFILLYNYELQITNVLPFFAYGEPLAV